jgi:GNAT superfamily N-acetyltransferase
MKLNITPGLAQEKDIGRILELNRLEYGPGDILATERDFAWRHSQNPAGQAIIPVIRDGRGEVVGFIWIVPVRMCLKGRDYSAATGTNLVIHPDYRNTFGYTKLMRRFQQAFEDENIPFHFSFVSEQTYQRQRTRNPQAVATVPLLIRPLDTRALAHTYFTKNIQRFIIGATGDVVAPFVFRQRWVASGSDITVQALDCFGPDLDEFWLTVRDKVPIIGVRDRAFLEWRFAPVCQRHYHILAARTRDRMLGYAVLRCTTIRGVKTGLVMDLLVCQGALGGTAGAGLMAEAEAYFRAQEMSIAAGLMVSSAAEYRILRRAGYRPVPQVIAPQVFRLGFFAHGGEPDLTATPARSWFVTLADHEGF